MYGVGSGKINFFTLLSTQFCIVSQAEVCKCSLCLVGNTQDNVFLGERKKYVR